MRTKLKQIEKSTRKANSYYDRVTCILKLILFSEIIENSKTLNTFDIGNHKKHGKANRFNSPIKTNEVLAK
ncbi:hypothetical protein QE382_004466 [Sphingobacterium zeae]|uniref:Uncharacterized protein n=1 Tax=Sphingobacterium zeae TaxID=1776859 RepID=A0ABU0UC94_9SPHI|nr:hypothetical protein [Sphingobacterium zeae]